MNLRARLSHWPTTAAGAAVGGAINVVLQSWGCVLPSDWMLWAITVAPVLLGLLGK